MIEYEYRINQGTYYFYSDGHMRYGADEVAIMFYIDSDLNEDDPVWMVMKHGSPKLVEEEYDRMRNKLLKSNSFKASDLHVVTGKWDLEQLNQVINCTGYVKKFLEFHNVDITKFTGDSRNENQKLISG